MTDPPMCTEAGLVLHSGDLLRKSGFCDGDAPDDLLDWLEQRGISAEGLPWRVALYRLARERLVPALGQRVEITYVDGNHNPVRAERVDGVDVTPCWTGDQERPALTPDAVIVPLADVLVLLQGGRGCPGLLTWLDARSRSVLASIIQGLYQNASEYARLRDSEVMTQKTLELAEALESAIAFVDDVGGPPTEAQRHEIELWVQGGFLLRRSSLKPGDRHHAGAMLLAALGPREA